MLESLTAKEREAFLAERLVHDQTDMLYKICELLLSGHENPDSLILRRLALNKVEKFRHLEQIYGHLLEFAARDSEEALQRKRFDFAKRLLSCLQFDAAEAIIKSSLEIAYQTDDFAIMHELYDLADCFPEDRPLTLDREMRQEVIRHATDIALLHKLLMDVREVKDAPNIEQHRPLFEQAKAEALARSAQGPLCAKANYYFLKTLTICHAFLGEFEQMLPLQEALVAHIEAHPHTVVDHEYSHVREMATLIRLYWRIKKLGSYRLAVAALETRKFASKIAEAERMHWRFPFILGMAIELGDKAKGENECNLIFELLDNAKGQHFKRGFVSENLYVSAYFYLATGNHQMLPKVFGRINRLEKADFHPRYDAVSRLIKVVYEIEMGNWEDAAILCNSLKKTKAITEFEGLDQVVTFLQECIRHQWIHGNETNTNWLASAALKLSQTLSGHWLLNYFDILAWIEARQKNIPLLNILKQRVIFEHGEL